MKFYRPEVFMLTRIKVSEYLQYHQGILADGYREKTTHAQVDPFSALCARKIGLLLSVV